MNVYYWLFFKKKRRRFAQNRKNNAALSTGASFWLCSSEGIQCINAWRPCLLATAKSCTVKDGPISKLQKHNDNLCFRNTGTFPGLLGIWKVGGSAQRPPLPPGKKSKKSLRKSWEIVLYSWHNRGVSRKEALISLLYRITHAQIVLSFEGISKWKRLAEFEIQVSREY